MNIKKNEHSVIGAVTFAIHASFNNFGLVASAGIAMYGILFFLRYLFGLLVPYLLRITSPEAIYFLNNHQMPADRVIILKTMITIIPAMILLFALFFAFTIGFYKIALDIKDKRVTSINYFSLFIHLGLRSLIAAIVYYLIVYIGLALLIIPGFIFATKFFLFPFFIIDKDASVIESLKLSWRATHGWASYAVFIMIVAILIAQFVSAKYQLNFLILLNPLIVLASAHIYRQLMSK